MHKLLSGLLESRIAVQQLDSHRRALTLVEVLIVTVIVGILAALMTIVIKAATERAKLTVCTTNLSQIGRAVELYLADNNEFLPPYFDLAGITNGTVRHEDESQRFVHSLLSYSLDKSQFYCPMDAFRGRIDHEGGFDHSFKSFALSGAFIATYSPREFPFVHIRLSSVPSPSLTHYLQDMQIAPFGKNLYYTGHGKSQNVLYLDGHVKYNSTDRKLCDVPGQQLGCPTE